MVFTQASQLRITQRTGDTGWVALAVALERASDALGTTWSEAMATIKSSVLSVNGGSAYYQGLFVRGANWKATPMRVAIGTAAATSTTQRAGTISHIKTDGMVYDYAAVVTPEGYIQPINITEQKWQVHNSGDLVQVTASWTVT